MVPVGLIATFVGFPALAAAYTVTIINRADTDVVAWNANNGGSPIPTLVSGNADSTIPVNGSSVYDIPDAWAGNWQVNTKAEGGAWSISGQESLIEGSFHGGFWMDISNVKGFSLPIVCGCKEAGMVAGCNLDLKAMNGGCGVHTENELGVCVNAVPDGGAIPEFFAPCEDGSYAHSTHHAALVTTGHICSHKDQVCCIGTDCPDSAKQSGDKHIGAFPEGFPEVWTKKGTSARPISQGCNSTDAIMSSNSTCAKKYQACVAEGNKLVHILEGGS